MLLAASGGDPIQYALTLERAARAVGVNFLGGYSALVQKGFATGDRALIASIPEALSRTEHICSSVNIGSTKAGINMDAVAMMGKIIKEAAAVTAGSTTASGAPSSVVFCNAPEDKTPLWRGFSRPLRASEVIEWGFGPRRGGAALEKGRPGLQPERNFRHYLKDRLQGDRMGQLGGRSPRRLGVRVRHCRLLSCPTP
jgi:uncharacterized protein (UPF0210 family)